MSVFKTVIFDIETGSLPMDVIQEIAPPFKEASVKTGSLGLEKALEKIQQARNNHLGRIQDTAALNAEYGQVLAIGILGIDGPTILHGNEIAVLADFWKLALTDAVKGGIKWVGFYSMEFDLPFLLRRSLLMGVHVPKRLQPSPRYWPDFWVDLMDLWKAGDWKAKISLDRFCKAAGLPGKSGDGKHFQQQFKEDPDAAIAYLENDLAITKNLADRILPLLA